MWTLVQPQPPLRLEPFLNRVLHGDCLELLPQMPPESIDLVVTDPPYLVRYVARDGRRCANDDNAQWVRPAFAALYRVLKPDAFCVSFYGWSRADVFLAAWRAAGFRLVGHFVWTKTYSSRVGYTQARHESAYLLAKGQPQRPAEAPSDVQRFSYTGNKLHPTQKPVEGLLPLITAYSRVGDVVLDPFAGSGTTAVAARWLGRRFIAIEQMGLYYQHACARLGVPVAAPQGSVPPAPRAARQAVTLWVPPRSPARPVVWGPAKSRALARCLETLRERLLVMCFVGLVLLGLMLCDSPLSRVLWGSP